MPPMQALYFEKPCLASDLPILRSIYGDYIDYFPMGDIDALAQGIMRITGNASYAREKGERGRRFVLENFTWQIAAATIERELIGFEQARG